MRRRIALSVAGIIGGLLLTYPWVDCTVRQAPSPAPPDLPEWCLIGQVFPGDGVAVGNFVCTEVNSWTSRCSVVNLIVKAMR